MVRKATRGSGWDKPAPPDSVLYTLANEGETVRETFLRLMIPRGPDVLSKRAIELNFGAVEMLARRMKIQDHGDVRMSLWEPYEEQLALWKGLCAHHSVNILKPRQTGISTAGDFFDVLWTALQDALDGEVTCALIWDTREKSKEQISKCASFARQLGLPLERKPTTETVWFANGSRIKAYTAGALGSSRSLSFQRIHASEVPWWQQAGETWAALQPSLGLGASDLIETTMDMSGEPLAADLWRKDTNQRHKIFFSFEDHTAYRMDVEESGMTEEDEEWLLGEGFTDRESMAWWIHNLRTKFNDDVHRAFREYPQLERHAFSVAAGRWVHVNPPVVPPLWTLDIPSVIDDGRIWTVDFWGQIEETSLQLVIIVDTSQGVGGDSSVVTVIDKASDSMLAHFADNFCHRDDLAWIATKLQERLQRQVDYQRRNKRQFWLPDIPIIIETNGPGGYTFESVAEYGGWAIPWQTGSETDGTSYACLLAAKRGVESGNYFGPKLLEVECDRLHRKVHADGRTGPWVGPKDTLMTIGIGRLWIAKNPFIEAPTREGLAKQQAQLRDAMLRQEEERPTKQRGAW